MNDVMVRQRLVAQLNQLNARVGRIENGFKQRLTADEEDQAQDAAGDEVRNALAVKDLEEIAQIKQALIRLEMGQYRLCELCHKSIGAKRLNALPLTARCFSCAHLEARPESVR